MRWGKKSHTVTCCFCSEVKVVDTRCWNSMFILLDSARSLIISTCCCSATGVKIREGTWTYWGDRFWTANCYEGEECALATATPKWWLLWSLTWVVVKLLLLMCLMDISCMGGQPFWGELIIQSRANMWHTYYFLHFLASDDTALNICRRSMHIANAPSLRTCILAQ